MNAMIYIRGNRADYDEWAAMGAEGWGYDDVLPYFKRSEDNERGEDLFHGTGGPLPVRESRSMNPLVDAFIEAAKRGRPRAEPGLQRRPAGGLRSLPDHAARTGCAASTSVALPASGMERENLTVITDAHALRILFDGDRASASRSIARERSRRSAPRAR